MVSHRIAKQFGLFGLIAVCASPVTAHDDLTFASWTGPYMRSQILGMVRPFEAETGKNISVAHYNGGLEELRDQVTSANVVWDVIDMTEADSLRACDEGLLEELDRFSFPDGADGTPFEQDFVEGAINRCGVGNIQWSTTFIYDKAAFPDGGPSTIADFFDTKKFPGRRAVRRDPSVLVEWALMADGVKPEDIYATLETDEGLERAFGVMSQIRPGLRWWDSELDPIQLTTDGDVAVSSVWTTTAIEHTSADDAPIELVLDGHVTEMDLFVIPKGTERFEDALEFVQYASGTKALAEQAKYQANEPTRQSAIELVAPEVRATFSSAKENIDVLGMASDAAWWSQNYDRISERFEEWASGSSSRIPTGVVR